LTGPELLERVEGLLPAHRERVFPPTATLAMLLAQALSPDGSCRQAADDAAVKRLIAGLAPHSTSTSAYRQARATAIADDRDPHAGGRGSRPG